MCLEDSKMPWPLNIGNQGEGEKVHREANSFSCYEQSLGKWQCKASILVKNGSREKQENSKDKISVRSDF
jgi:hypothetical protein